MYGIIDRNSVPLIMHGFTSGTVRVRCSKMERPEDNVAHTHYDTQPTLFILFTIHIVCVWGGPTLLPSLLLYLWWHFPALSSLGHHASSWKLPFLKPFVLEKEKLENQTLSKYAFVLFSVLSLFLCLIVEI